MLAWIFHEWPRRPGLWPGAAVVRRSRRVRGLTAGPGASAGRNTPLPPLLVNVPGTALVVAQGARAWAALRNTCLRGWLEANSRRTRRVLRTTAAPILSSLMRMVAAQARASSVPCSARRRKWMMSV